MILISVIEKNIVIAFDRIIQNGDVEIEKTEKHKKKHFPVSNTDFTQIPLEEKGRYKINVNIGKMHFSKIVNVF